MMFPTQGFRAFAARSRPCTSRRQRRLLWPCQVRMRFLLIHRTSLYGMAVAAVATVAAGGELPAGLTPAIVIGLVVSWFWEPPRVPVHRFTTAWNVASALCLVYLAI